MEFAAKNADLPRELLFAVIKTESNFNENALSSKNAMGLMQLTKETYQFALGRFDGGELEKDIFNPKTNITLGALYLRYLMDMFGSLSEALAAYNAGPGNVKKWLSNENYTTDGKSLD